MNVVQYRQVKRVFEAARDLPQDERHALLDEQCADNVDVRREVESLLNSHDQLTNFLDAPALGENFGRDLSPESLVREDGGLPKRFGHFTIVRQLGAGGMGAVYLAEQDRPRRHVALKVIRPGLTAGQLLARFENEADMLGQLQHPGIAQVYEAGTIETEAGRQPFFAMEYVAGASLLEYAEANDLGTRQRLELMAKICSAVQHAHERGVIHRDLKPGNILVDRSAPGGQPKILDFGVARATDADIRTVTLRTDIGQLIGTVPYMSPEQAAGDPSDIDERSDVYALGVVTYELLTGRLPYDVSGKMIHEAVRCIREDEPTPASSYNPAFRGDVETIITKSLEKDKDRRYASAAALEADIQHYLRDEPISARPPSTAYQLRKFARRNRALVGGVVAVLLTLLVGVIGTSVGMVRAVTARDLAVSNEQKAMAELAKAEQVTGFLRKLLAGSAPQIAAGRDTELLRAVLDDAARDIDRDLTGQPEAELLIRDTIGDTYRQIGDFDSAESHLRRARELALAHLDPVDPAYLEVQHDLASLRLEQGRSEEAMELYRTNAERARAVLGPSHPTTIANEIGVLNVYRYRYEWLSVAEGAAALLPSAREALGEDHEQALRLMDLLADARNSLGQIDEAMALTRESLEIKRRRWGPAHPNTLACLQQLASSYRRLDRLEEAEPLYTEAYELAVEYYGPDHPSTANAMNSLALLYKSQRRFDEAEAMYRRVLDYNRRELGESHQYTLITMNNLAGVFGAQGRYDQAIPIMRERYDIHVRHFGAENPQTLMARLNLSICYDLAGEYDRALTEFEQLIATTRESPPEGNHLAYFLTKYAQCLYRTGRLENAEAALHEAIELLTGDDRATIGKRLDAIRTLVLICEELGRADDAARWRSLLPAD